MKKRLIISLIVFIAAVAVLTTLCILVRKNNLDPLGVDVWARDLAYNTRGEKGGLIYWFWRIFTEAGDLYVLAVLCVLMLIYTKLDYRFMIFLLGLIIQVFLNAAFKGVYQRPRPDAEMWWMVEKSTSFPSGHSTSVGFMCPFIIFLFLITEKNKKITIPVVAVFSLIFFIVPISRIVIGVHYFTDCVAGLALGASIAAVFMALTAVFIEYNILQKPILPMIFKKKNKEEEIKED
jgi:undecaprenyl-diphosphatase